MIRLNAHVTMNKCEEILFESIEDNFMTIANQLVISRRLYFQTETGYDIIRLQSLHYVKTRAHALSNTRYAKFHKQNNYSIGYHQEKNLKQKNAYIRVETFRNALKIERQNDATNKQINR